jgi:hypothetical protein
MNRPRGRWNTTRRSGDIVEWTDLLYTYLVPQWVEASVLFLPPSVAVEDCRGGRHNDPAALGSNMFEFADTSEFTPSANLALVGAVVGRLLEVWRSPGCTGSARFWVMRCAEVDRG